MIKKNPKEKLKDMASFRWTDELPMIPLRNIVVFPQMIVPLFIGREKSVKALEDSLSHGQMVVFASQLDEEVEEPGVKDLCTIGTLAEIVQMINLPDGTTKVLVEGVARVTIDDYVQENPFFKVEITKIEEPKEPSVELEALIRVAIKQFENYVKLNKRIPTETLMSIINVESPGRLADLISSYLSLKIEEKQQILEAAKPSERLKKLSELLDKEIEVLEVEKKLQGKVRKQIEKVQKEYYLKEKLKAIQDELGVEEESSNPEITEYKKRIKDAKMLSEAKERALKEVDRLAKMPSMVSEASVIRTYLDWLIELPWQKKSRSKVDINAVEKVLDQDHYGLKKVKERITEYFAVLQLTNKMPTTILCLVGPPGVGKTSIASSIANSMGRQFTRVSLGGVRDEAEIRGHRRTYVGALPGRIIQAINKCKANNPVILLDEIDKMATDFRGDPSAALLEVLDPEQNKSFSDHYLEVPFDLSNVLFITTANTMDPIPKPLRDRMEIISVSGYTEEEKAQIALRYLLPKELKSHGLEKDSFDLNEAMVQIIIQEYTREAGVRNLDRTLATVCRKVASNKVREQDDNKINIDKKVLEEYLGAPKYRFGLAEEQDQIGVATGLVWTEVGGDTIPIEVTVLKGKGDITLTGQLGDVMQESMKAAISVIRSRAQSIGLPESFYRKTDIHIHVPEGAVPKDGPSAGITIATALASALAKNPIRRDVAMTGEITLRGKVLPIGGLKEKLLAAKRAGIKVVIIPDENRKDLDEIKKDVEIDLQIFPAKTIDDVFAHAFSKKFTKDTSHESDDIDDKEFKIKIEDIHPDEGMPGDYPEPPQIVV